MEISELSGTRLKYFTKAINLFSRQSFEIVTLNDVAEAVGKTRTNLYSYFNSKQEILDLMYEYFTHHFTKSRKPLEALKPIVEHGTVLEMITSVGYFFDPSNRELMADILIVLHQRSVFDERARCIIKELIIDDGIRYVEEVFDYAINIGRLAPFTTHWLARIINNTQYSEHLQSTVDPDYTHDEFEKKDMMPIYQQVAAMIIDLRSPYANLEDTRRRRNPLTKP